jgi:hypothetical protein
MRIYSRMYLRAISILLPLSALHLAYTAEAQMSCMVTFTCPSARGACASNMGGQVTSRGPFPFASIADCNIAARNANPNLGGVGISCSCTSTEENTPAEQKPPGPHIRWNEQEKSWYPEPGYNWVIDPPVPGDFRVTWVPNERSDSHPHVVASETEGPSGCAGDCDRDIGGMRLCKH